MNGVAVVYGKGAIRFADSQSVLFRKQKQPELELWGIGQFAVLICLMSVFEGGGETYSPSQVYTFLLIRNILESLIVTDFQLGSGILKMCVCILTLV